MFLKFLCYSFLLIVMVAGTNEVIKGKIANHPACAEDVKRS
jgi:hypothetical protein